MDQPSAPTPVPARFPKVGPYQELDRQALYALYARHFHQAPGAGDALQWLVLVLHHAGHLDDAMLADAATVAGLPLADLRGLRSFYHFLDQRQACRYRILVSTNIIDNLKGAAESLAFLREHFSGRTDIVISETSCTGFSDLAPGALVNGFAIPLFSPARAQEIATAIDRGIPMASWPGHWFDTRSRSHVRDILLNMTAPAGRALATAGNGSREDFIAELKASALRGRGGAGFPTWQKWQTARLAPGPVKYVVCNADEGEPGTFKDRVLLEEHFDALVEGMALGAWAIGAQRGFIYLRGEYLYLHAQLQQHIRQRQAQGFRIGGQALDFSLEIHLGAGAYICGEESALLESLEGKRGIPRLRPPFPATHGYEGAPTVVNNVETWIATAWIAMHGGAAFAALGNARSAGTKLHSISGACERPGIYEFPLGTSVQTLLQACGGTHAGAVQVGGPSGKLLFPGEYDTPVDFDHVSSGGSFMVFPADIDPLEIVANFTAFFAHESCGFCTPCRAGSQVLHDSLSGIREGRTPAHRIAELQELVTLMQVTSHCGLGQTAGNPLQALLDKRPECLQTAAHGDIFHRSPSA